jgi:uncharacterized membrane protein
VAIGVLWGLHQLLIIVVGFTIRIDPDALATTRYRIATLENWGLVILAVLWLGGVAALYYYYKKDREKGSLWRRFLIVTSSELVFIAIMHLVTRLLLS